MTDQLSPNQPITKMDNRHPITPSQQLMSTIRKEAESYESLITAAYRAGADEQLKQCLDWFKEFYRGETWMLRDLRSFRLAMRPEPNPPTVKEALQALDSLEGFTGCLTEVDTIRRTLENLNGQN